MEESMAFPCAKTLRKAMKTLITALVLSAATSCAFALGADSKATEWNSASASERTTWVSRAVDAANNRQSHQFTRGEVSACLSSLLQRPVPAQVAAMSLSDATAGCMAIIKNQR